MNYWIAIVIEYIVVLNTCDNKVGKTMRRNTKMELMRDIKKRNEKFVTVELSAYADNLTPGS